MKSLNKKGQSEVVSTVLMILIGIIAITIVAAFVINFVKNQTEKGKCFDVLDKVEVVNSPSYTCYESPNAMRVQIHIGETENLLDGFSIEIGGANTKQVKILNGSQSAGVQMYKNPAGPVEIPGDNEERTYNITGITSRPDVVRVYPIMKGGKVCESSSAVNMISLCQVV